MANLPDYLDIYLVVGRERGLIAEAVRVSAKIPEAKLHALAVKTLSNYSKHIFNTPVDEAFGDYEWEG